MALRLFSRRKKAGGDEASTALLEPEAPGQSSLLIDFTPAPPEAADTDPLVRLSQQQRYNTILRGREQWFQHPGGAAIVEEAERELEGCMALVPAGNVAIPQTIDSQPGCAEEEFDVAPFLLDAHAVTNARYQKFVDGDGYEALEFWPEEIWPHLIELKDRTGELAPQFWRNGRHDIRLADHPVVGVSWYEAQAYALWIGQRLPTEAEWQMAASWHIKSSTDIMRRFPWGDVMDGTRCNVWSSRRGTTVPVTEYESGAAPNQVRQLVGNVWEWVDTEFTVTDNVGQAIIAEMPMRVVRGGAFDTYFETQATTLFRTGQLALARNHNSGFRCAMDLSEAHWLNRD